MQNPSSAQLRSQILLLIDSFCSDILQFQEFKIRDVLFIFWLVWSKIQLFYKYTLQIQSMLGDSSNQSQFIPVDDDLYVVQCIKDKRFVNGKIQYLVKWMNWNKPEDLTWQPPENLSTVKELIAEFERNHSGSQANKDHKNVKRNFQSTPAKKQAIKKKKLIKKAQAKGSYVKVETSRQKPRDMVKKQLQNTEFIDILSPEACSESFSDKLSDLSKETKAENSVGCFNSIYIRDDGQIFYQADIINRKGQTIGVKLIPNKEIKSYEKVLLLKFLESYLIDEDRYSEMI